MMRKFSTLTIAFSFLAILIPFILTAQKDKLAPEFQELKKLTVQDSMALVNLPVLEMPDWLKGPDAPLLLDVVDNSQQIYWRPVFAQVQYECGQASGVGLGFTYAINLERDLPSDVPENQYPTHYTWNWGNGGDGWYGVSYFHSFEIIRLGGNPNVVTYGGMTGEGPEMWMSGYDKYYEAMHNRISEVYQIPLSTEEGINTLRHWIHNHLDGSDVGGVANFYTNAPGGMPTLPAGTPEAGKYVVTSWGGANHGLTVAGYHDSICWDYNNDGQYTNDLDINGDGEITPRDWEIGGLKFANTYSGGPNFGNDGFSYMTYKSCADSYGSGGIWNSAVHVLYAKENVDPLLTAKITLKHNCRNRIKVEMGVSTDLNSETPEYILGFPIFNYQGGCNYMQGGTEEEDRIIEFGLDLTPFLNLLESGTPVRYFLLVTEKDPEGWGVGDMISYSLMDYSNGVEEIICDQSNIPLIHNSLSKFWVEHTMVFNDVEVTSETLTPATVYEPYTEQLEATGGTTDYTWEYDMNYTETYSTNDFPLANAQNITPGNTGSGYTTKQLDFDFPFYGKIFSEVRVHADGYITFEDLTNWVYQVYDFLLYTKNKYISPFHSDLKLYTATGDGIWYEGDENSATFRWKASVEGAQNTSDLNFAVELFANGNICFYYGGINDYPNISWLSGLSDGNNKFYQFTNISNDNSLPVNHKIDFEATHYPDGFSVSRTGEFNGVAVDNIADFPIKFRVTDENNLVDSKVVYFSTDGSNFIVVDDISVYAGDDDIIEYGETVVLSVDIKNLGEETISGNEMSISVESDHITLIDSVEFLGDFEPGEIKSFSGAFIFEVDTQIPNEFEITLPTLIADDSGEEWSSHIYLTAYTPELYAGSVIIDEGGNGGLDPGETAEMIINVYNGGGANAPDVLGILSTTDPYITINADSSNLDVINAGGSDQLVFNITASDDTPLGYIVEFDISIEAYGGYTASDQVYIVCGLLFESFESGNFDANPWSFTGDADWVIDDVVSYDGIYSAKSGDIDDDKISGIQLELFVLGDGDISFYRKVSSESNYDYLVFYIDGIAMDSWAGELEWMEFSYPVTDGLHSFSWVYEKDYSVSNGDDCGWVDLITLPPFGDQSPQIAILPETIEVLIQQDPLLQDTLWIQNYGTGPVFYTVAIIDSIGNPIEWLTAENETGGINSGAIDDVPLFFDATGMEDGEYQTEIIITDHIGGEYLIPVTMTVDLVNSIQPNSGLVNKVISIPNPFSNETTIQFKLRKQSKVQIDIFNTRGEHMKRLNSLSILDSGLHQINWDATNDLGSKVDNGLYYYRIQAGTTVYTGKLIFLK